MLLGGRRLVWFCISCDFQLQQKLLRYQPSAMFPVCLDSPRQLNGRFVGCCSQKSHQMERGTLHICSPVMQSSHHTRCGQVLPLTLTPRGCCCLPPGHDTAPCYSVKKSTPGSCSHSCRCQIPPDLHNALGLTTGGGESHSAIVCLLLIT